MNSDMTRMCRVLGLVTCAGALASGEAVGQADEIAIGDVTADVVSWSDPAQRLGYILISSYNTVSDGAIEPNEAAVAAMIDDVQRLFSVDTPRLYFAGFSGTARISWMFGEGLSQHTAGVIGFGAGLPSATWLMTLLLESEAPFAFYGGAGELDFNYEEVLELDWELDSQELAHVVESDSLLAPLRRDRRFGDVLVQLG